MRYVEKSQACAQQFSYAAFHKRVSAILEKDD
jgi:hypothetical protein